MYRIIKDGIQIGIVEKPRYIHLMKNGCFGACEESKATGIAFEGNPYQLFNRDELVGHKGIVRLVEIDGGNEFNKSIINLMKEDNHLGNQTDALVKQLEFYEELIVELANIIYA